jgi:hypothetical protein
MTRSLALRLLWLVLFSSTDFAQHGEPPSIQLQGQGTDTVGRPTTAAGQPVAQATGAPAVQTPLQIGPYTVSGPPVKTLHTWFERELDSPPFFNFESYQQYGSFKHKFVNSGTCYGISMFTLRYFQWFVLPHLLSDPQLAAAKPRRLPAYARRVAQDMGLPGWILGAPTDDTAGRKLTAAERTARIAPYRLRTLLKGKPDLTKALGKSIEQIAKEEATRMFDNQQYLVNLGSRVAQFLDRTIFGRVNRESVLGRKFFGVGGFGLMKQYVEDTSLGAFELGFYGSKIKPMWGHSVVGFQIVQYAATKRGAAGSFEAYRIDLCDSNDPDNGSDNCYWYFPSERSFAPSKAYADYYDGDNPLLPKGKDFLFSAQMGPSAEQQLLSVEKNSFNRWMLDFKKVGAGQ